MGLARRLAKQLTVERVGVARAAVEAHERQPGACRLVKGLAHAAGPTPALGVDEDGGSAAFGQFEGVAAALRLIGRSDQRQRHGRWRAGPEPIVGMYEHVDSGWLRDSFAL